MIFRHTTEKMYLAIGYFYSDDSNYLNLTFQVTSLKPHQLNGSYKKRRTSSQRQKASNTCIRPTVSLVKILTKHLLYWARASRSFLSGAMSFQTKSKGLLPNNSLWFSCTELDFKCARKSSNSKVL